MSGSNPITSWIKSCMETNDGRVALMEDRVAEHSINAQKLSDERHNSSRPHNVIQHEMRSRPNFRPSIAISAYGNQEAGEISSFRAMRYYQGQSVQRRDEILTEIAKSA